MTKVKSTHTVALDLYFCIIIFHCPIKLWLKTP